MFLRLVTTLLFNLSEAIRYGVRSVARRVSRPPPLAVWLRVEGDLAYLPPPRRLPWLVRYLKRVQGHPLSEASSLRTLTRDLAVLAELKHVRALVVHLEGFEGNGATLSALLQAVEPFRRANKPVWGYSRLTSSGEYRLLGSLDRFFLAPGGRLELAGYQADVLSLQKTLAMVGVRPQFVRRGEFKTAPEMFTRDSISPAQEKTLGAILDDRFGALTAAVSTGRKRSADEAKALVEGGPYGARRAVDAKLADGLADPAAIEEQLKAEIGKDLEVVPYGDVEGAWARAKPRFRPLRRPAFTAIVPIHGIITVGEGRSGGGVAGSDSVVASLEKAVESKRAKSILLHVDSRGGSATASELIHAAVVRAAKEKPVLCYVDGVAASGGYMAAVGAKQIWCAPESIMGSIGVFGGKFELEGLLSFLQVGVDSVRRGAHSGMYSPLRPWTADELALLDREIEDTYRDFVRLVAEGRRLSEQVVHAVGEGRVFTGAAALENKLVDGLCGFGEAIGKACALGGLAADAPLGWIDATPRATNPLALLRGAARERLWALWAGSIPA